MNKILLSIAAVLGLGAGAYYFLPQNQINQYAQYLPESISSFLIKEEVDASQEVVTATEEDVQLKDQEKFNKEIPQNAIQEGVQVHNDVVQTVESAQEDQQQIRDEKIPAVEQTKQKDSQLTQQTVEKSAPQHQAPLPQVSKTQNSSPEMKKIQKEIEKVQKTISKLDNENEGLQNRFQKILKKNRDLAIKLKQIDEKLGSTN